MQFTTAPLTHTHTQTHLTHPITHTHRHPHILKCKYCWQGLAYLNTSLSREFKHSCVSVCVCVCVFVPLSRTPHRTPHQLKLKLKSASEKMNRCSPAKYTQKPTGRRFKSSSYVYTVIVLQRYIDITLRLKTEPFKSK